MTEKIGLHHNGSSLCALIAQQSYEREREIAKVELWGWINSIPGRWPWQSGACEGGFPPPGWARTCAVDSSEDARLIICPHSENIAEVHPILLYRNNHLSIYARQKIKKKTVATTNLLKIVWSCTSCDRDLVLIFGHHPMISFLRETLTLEMVHFVKGANAEHYYIYMFDSNPYIRSAVSVVSSIPSFRDGVLTNKSGLASKICLSSRIVYGPSIL